MKTLHIDIETYSSVDLSKCGVYKYASAPDFKILLFGYAVDDGEVKIIDIEHGEKIPADIREALFDYSVEKWAWNANFERVCLSRHFKDLPDYINPISWRCAMVWAQYLTLPASLEHAGTVFGLETQKMTEGKELIKLFCSPREVRPADTQIALGASGVNTKWDAFKAYCIRDVEVEREFTQQLRNTPVPDSVWEEYALDQSINDRGVALDMEFVNAAIAADERSRAALTRKMRRLTELDNPNSVSQMKNWLADNGLETDTLGKKAVSEMLKTAPEMLGEVLSLRQSLAKSSVAKYTAMQNAVCPDGRARGMFQFYGARTGRWTGRLIQLQNLPQNHMPDLAQARAIVKSSDYAALEMLYDSTPEVLSELIRTAFVPREGCKFIVADFASIEAVVLAWIAGEEWTLEAYRTKRDLYIENAEIMFNKPKGSINKKDPLRQKSKIAVLACGYGGSVGALKQFGALDMGITEDELMPLVNAWRKANPNIIKFWADVERAAIAAVRESAKVNVSCTAFEMLHSNLTIKLPSGRRLFYLKPRIEANRFTMDCVTYEGIGKSRKWERTDTYGGKLTENIVQSMSRDILTDALRAVNGNGYKIVMHVHDEIVVETPQNADVADVCEVMSQPPPWAKDLPLRVEGFESGFYLKD